MNRSMAHNRKVMLLAGLMATGLIVAAAPADAARAQAKSASAAGEKHAPARKTSPYRPNSVPSSAMYYQSIWGVDNLLVRIAASGNLVRFSYRVTDPARAGVLGDKHQAPALIDPRSRAVLQVPVLEQVGPLWQAGEEKQVKMEKGKRYWMTFSNKGNPVRPGDRVTVVIGSFRAEGLVVE